MVGNMGTTDRSAASDVVPALAAKRSELARLVIETERALSRLRSDLAHVEGAMKLFDCDAAACTTEARWREKVTFRYGELPMLVLHLLKSAEQPLSTVEIARRALLGRCPEPISQQHLRWATIRVGKILSRLKAAGKLTSERCGGRTMVWAIDSTYPAE